MKKAVIGFIAVCLISCAVFLSFLNRAATPVPDLVAFNDALMSESGSVADILISEYERMETERQRRDMILKVIIFSYTGVLVISVLCLYLYCEQRILKPFRKLRRFARDVAMGNLDIPLEMDRSENFGAFTESFDLMREELKTARENERTAERSKKELVATLSHDIKTPVATIQAVTELMLVTSNDDEDKKQLGIINEKAEQINTLITNMFHATLEELQQLSVTVSEIHSTELPVLIQSSDYKMQVKPFKIPNCIVLADTVRLQQVFDNIIVNSYKYANTTIEVNAVFEEQFLIIEITDFGYGVPKDELPLLFNKFFRGKDSENQSGYGLGLYISKYLMKQMSGDIYCRNHENGFTVELRLRLAM